MAAATGPVLLTGRYHTHRSEHGVPIATSIGKPRWPLPYTLEHEVRDLMPWGLFGRDLAWAEFERRYRARLDRIGVARLRAQFDAIAAEHPGRPLVLLCWERSGEPCHRRVFADWWLEWTGQSAPEVDTPNVGTPKPTQNDDIAHSGQVPCAQLPMRTQLSMTDDREDR
jgi:hypothetical protein